MSRTSFADMNHAGRRNGTETFGVDDNVMRSIDAGRPHSLIDDMRNASLMWRTAPKVDGTPFRLEERQTEVITVLAFTLHRHADQR